MYALLGSFHTLVYTLTHFTRYPRRYDAHLQVCKAPVWTPKELNDAYNLSQASSKCLQPPCQEDTCEGMRIGGPSLKCFPALRTARDIRS